VDIGFETIGNATLICHDGGPVLATDPWLRGSAYFGSWTLSHEIPPEQLAAVRAAPYVWISHGHPDHLSLESLELLRDKQILLPDHVGGRIQRELAAQGYRVRVLRDGEWTQLAPRTRVLCLSDYNQDAVLLVELGGRLIVDANDASDRGGGDFLRATASRYAESYLLCLTGYGDADMIHFYDEQGRQVLPAAADKQDLGPGIAGLLQHYGLRNFAPFSSMHRYQRSDSVWANAYATEIDEHARGFPLEPERMLPPFARVDFARGTVESIRPPRAPELVHPPEAFGDSWSDELEAADVAQLRAYFEGIEHLRGFLGWVRFVVGGREHVLELAPEHRARGISFELPRASLMTAVRYEIFDDLMIGNYMRTTLHGAWPARNAAGLYPDFSPFLGKYWDNGRARTRAELRAYFAAYAARGFMGPGPTPETAAAWRVAQSYLA